LKQVLTVHSGIFIPSSLSDLLVLCLYTETLAKGKSLAQRYIPRNKIKNVISIKPKFIVVRARIIRRLLPCAMLLQARCWTGEHTDVSEKSVLFTLYFEKETISCSKIHTQNYTASHPR